MNRGSKPSKYLGESDSGSAHSPCKGPAASGIKEQQVPGGMKERERGQKKEMGLVPHGDSLGLNSKCDGKPPGFRQGPLSRQNSSSVRAVSSTPCPRPNTVSNPQ